VARPSEKDLDYVNRAERMSWKDLAGLWEQIKAHQTPDWDKGKALEHLVIRAFRLNKLEADYPYNVSPGGKSIEQIDGFSIWNVTPSSSNAKTRTRLTSWRSRSFAISSSGALTQPLDVCSLPNILPIRRLF
jgi:hypothetical protein